MKSLPARPSLEHLKTQAKDLLAAAKRGDETARARFAAALPSLPPELALHDAQSVIAREHGCPSWHALRERVAEASNLHALYAPHLIVQLPADVVAAALATGADLGGGALEVPSRLPLIALRNALLAVSAVAPLDVARPSSLAAIARAETGDKLVAIFAQRDPAAEEPHAHDLHPVGVVARLVRVVPREGGTWIVVQALAWLTLEDVVEEEGCRFALVTRFDIIDDGCGPADALREKVAAFARSLPEPEPILQRALAMSPSELADAAVANAVCAVADKARYAAEPRLSRRIEQALALVG